MDLVPGGRRQEGGELLGGRCRVIPRMYLARCTFPLNVSKSSVMGAFAAPLYFP